MANTFPVEIKTPEGSVYNGEVEMISTRTVTGSIGIMANHEPIMALLEPGELRLHTGGNQIERFVAGDGYLQMANNRALLLLEEAVRPQDISRADYEAKLEEARERLGLCEPGSADFERGDRDVKRIEKFLEVLQAQDAGINSPTK